MARELRSCFGNVERRDHSRSRLLTANRGRSGDSMNRVARLFPSRALAAVAFLASIGAQSADATIVIAVSTADQSSWETRVGGAYVPAAEADGFPDYLKPNVGGAAVWQARYRFSLPAGASGVTLVISDISVDDRAVLGLNGTIIPGADHVIFDTTGPGIHDFGAGAVPHVFTSLPNVAVSTGFLIGGENELIAYVNNTGSSFPGAGVSAGGPTALRVIGELSYELAQADAVPVSATLTLLGVGLVGLLAMRRRRA